MDDPHGRFHEQPWLLETFAAELLKDCGDPATAPDLVMAVVTLGEAAQMVDEAVAIREAVHPDAIPDTGRHDLLGTTAADPEEELDGGAIHKRARGGAQLFYNVIYLTIPRRFGRHPI